MTIGPTLARCKIERSKSALTGVGIVKVITTASGLADSYTDTAKGGLTHRGHPTRASQPHRLRHGQ